MSDEFEQPSHMAKPDLDDPNTWAKTTLTHSEWFRHTAPQLGLDTEVIILGCALSNIIGDDENSFGLIAVYLPEYTQLAKTSIFNRMDWEIMLPELPETIRERIIKIRNKLEDLNWEGRDNFLKAREIWVKGVRNFTRHQIALNKHYRDVLRYYDEANPVWSPYWSEFLYG